VPLAAGNPAFGAAQKSTICKLTARPPQVDGQLTDDCWQDAVEIPLTDGGRGTGAKGRHAFIMTAYDSKCLYFAISVPRVHDLPADGPMTLGRTHDQDLSAYDRVMLSLDVDRDFTTWYTIEIDQRGCIAESCWGDNRWNPTMGIVADADEDRWRIEVAIPFQEMLPAAPKPNDAWGLAVIRTIPAVRTEGWLPSDGGRPRPESFGVLRFR
jgi:hypothetical protein